MSDPKSHQEPSMEEILASIRRIISEDDLVAKEGQDRTLRDVGQEPLVVPKEGSIVDESEGGGLELTEELRPEPSTGKQFVQPPSDAGMIAPQPSNATTSQLSVALPVERLAQSMEVSACTIEDLVKEIMRPMIKEWLDDNLPALVKRLVRREFRRNSRRAADGIGD